MAASPDHWNVYVTLGTSALSIAGTLGGLWLGSFIQSKRDAEQRKYTDRTRFHDVRLDAYYKFMTATLGIWAGAGSWAAQIPDGVDIQTYLNNGDLFHEFNKAASMVLLVASPAAKKKAIAVNVQCSKINSVENPSEMPAALEKLIDVRTAFEVVVRKELGID